MSYVCPLLEYTTSVLHINATMSDQDLSDSSSVTTRVAYEIVQFEVQNGSIRYETTNSVTLSSILDELHPYGIAKGLAETSHPEMRVNAWHQIEDTWKS